MRVVYSARAGRDLAEIVEFLGARNGHAALVVAATIRKRVALLAHHPFSGRTQDIEGVRKAVTVPFGYLVYHAVDETAQVVTILSIRHPSRDRPFGDA